MNKKFVFLFILICTIQFSNAQKGDLFVKTSDKGLYLEHKVAAKESFYAIGRLYNVHPKSIATYNKLDMSKGLQIDQKIRIPLTDTNFNQQIGSGTPVYYKSGDKESLINVSGKYNNVSPNYLQWWNDLRGYDLKKDTKLIIGFLQSKEMKSITIKGEPDGEVRVADVDEIVQIVPKEKEKEKEEIEKEGEAELKAEKKEEKREKKDPAPVIKEERKPVLPGSGYFKNDFDQQLKITPLSKDETVTSGIFKTTSGWSDAKYYLLIDGISPGTIVKVINPSNNKSIYAKVLGVMAGIRQNEGYNIRISNAGASALDISEQDKFIVKVNY